MTKLEEINRYIKEDEGNEVNYFILVKFEDKPSPRYYINRKDINNINKIPIIEYQAYMTTSRKKALCHEELARHYGADTILIRQQEDQLEIDSQKYVSESYIETKQDKQSL